jgi:hypothetical protein
VNINSEEFSGWNERMVVADRHLATTYLSRNIFDWLYILDDPPRFCDLEFYFGQPTIKDDYYHWSFVVTNFTVYFFSTHAMEAVEVYSYNAWKRDGARFTRRLGSNPQPSSLVDYTLSLGGWLQALR